jgi:pimeloyl-ACP methyl ester carboxylesterase
MDAMEALKSGVSLIKGVASYGEWVARARPAGSKARVNVDDIDMFFRRYGSGEPVLLLHGGFMFAETWLGQIPTLAKSLQLFAPDVRGHGRTTLGTRPLTYRQLADDALGFIQQLGVGPVHVVGWSDGGCTALGMSIKRPDLLRSITLLGTPWNVSNYGDVAMHELVALTDPAAPSAWGLRIVRRCLTPEHYRGAEFLAALRNLWVNTLDFTTDELGSIETPTLVIATDRDEFLSDRPDPTELFEQLTSAIPGARMEVVRGGTHLVHILQPDAVNRLILEFLETVPAR